MSKIFILEDDTERINLFIETLQGHDLTICTDYEAGTKKWEPPYDLVLLDHDLGGSVFVDSHGDVPTGYHFVKFMGEASSSKIPVIVHSWNGGGTLNMLSLLRENGWPCVSQTFGEKLLKSLALGLA